MNAPLCSCDTYGSSGVRNTCSTAGELKRSINQLRAEISRLKAVIGKCRAALETGLEVVDPPPERSCSCHLSPPCNDCVDYSRLREFFNFTEEALSIADADASILRQHDEALIELCAEVCEEYQGSSETCAAAIRELKSQL